MFVKKYWFLIRIQNSENYKKKKEFILLVMYEIEDVGNQKQAKNFN